MIQYIQEKEIVFYSLPSTYILLSAKESWFSRILKRIQTNVAATARTVKKVIARSDLGHKQARLSPGQYDFDPN